MISGRINTTSKAEFFPCLKAAVPPCVYITLENGDIILSYDFKHRRNLPLEVLVFKNAEKKWYRVHKKDELTELMWNYHRKQQRKLHIKNANSYMKHSRAKKKGGAGKVSHDKTVTDYECSNNPLHDFRRSMCVNWND